MSDDWREHGVAASRSTLDGDRRCQHGEFGRPGRRRGTGIGLDSGTLRRLAIVALLVLLGVTVASGSAAAAPCDASGERPAVVATVGGAHYGPGADVSVYRGSELVLDLCAPPGSDHDLTASGRDGLEELRGSRSHLVLRVGGHAGDPANGSLAANGTPLGALVEPRAVPGPNLTLAGTAVETSLVDGPLAVPGRGRAAALREADRRFRRREAIARSSFAALENGSSPATDGDGANRSGSVDSRSNASLSAAASSYERFRAASRSLRAALYAVAASDAASARTARAITSLRRREAALGADARSSLRSHDRDLVERERSLTWSLRLRVLGVGIAGLLVGGLAGAVLPAIRGRRARRRLERGEWTTYSRRVVLPAAAGALLLALGVGWLALVAGGPLLEVVA